MKLSILAIAVVLSPSINARRVQDTTTSTPDATDPPSCAELRLTTAYIRETAAKCLNEYGSDAKVADWTYDLSSFSEDQIQSMTTELGIEESFNTMHYFVSNEGKKYQDNWPDVNYPSDVDGVRAYFFEDHGGNPPLNWAVHGQLGDITLGSWFNISGQVLCTVCADDSTSSGYIIGLSSISLCIVSLATLLF